MYYVFMDNFRGFKETIIPIRRANFLVGENSTGKSSFLTLLGLYSTSQFWLTQDFTTGEFSNLGGFNDMVSVASEIKNRFTVGNFRVFSKKQNETSHERTFTLMTFRNEEGLPKLSRYLHYENGRLVKILFFRKSIRYKLIEYAKTFETRDEFLQFGLQTFRDDWLDRKGFKDLRKDFPMESKHRLPPAYLLTLIESLDAQGKRKKIGLGSYLPMIFDLTWLAPVRTKPRRIYGGFKPNFTPEGEHTPHLIRKALSARTKGSAKKFKELIEIFGKSSGLFKRVNTHLFGKDPSAPFEVQVEIHGAPLNISNVGYGVSQILPVLVEMLTSGEGHWFAIQQPEVHLHPRAQAALGELIHFLVKEYNHHYVIETHSDYMIDRFRLSIKEEKGPSECQVIFFEKSKDGNCAYPLTINEKGQYPKDQPKNFRDFFIREEMELLGI